MNARPVYSVTQINNYIKGMLDSDRVLTGVFIRGEISNYKVYPSGHHYFSLKDEGGAIRCVLFRREASSLRFRPQSGMMVVAYGRITVFPRDGAYQLYVSVLQPDGVGDLHVAFEQLKARLSAEGLFDLEHKKPLPKYPKRIALVTSPAGAAVRDMLRILGARWPMAEAYVVPCRVQGAEAPAEIAGAIAWSYYRLGRGRSGVETGKKPERRWPETCDGLIRDYGIDGMLPGDFVETIERFDVAWTQRAGTFAQTGSCTPVTLE